MTVVRAVDMSEWGGELTAEECEGLKAEGVELVLIAANGKAGVGDRNDYFVQTAQAAYAAGLGVAAYVWPPSFVDDFIPYIKSAGVPLAFVALDVEGAVSIWARDIDVVRQAGFRPVVYTSETQWRKHTLRTEAPLWDASYFDGDGAMNAWPNDVHAALWVPYGEWTSRVGWQFQGTTAVGGQSVDQNIFSREWLYGEPWWFPESLDYVPEEDTNVAYVTQEAFEEFKRGLSEYQTGVEMYLNDVEADGRLTHDRLLDIAAGHDHLAALYRGLAQALKVPQS